MNWYERRTEIVDLLRWLDDRGELCLDDAITLVEKPWKWEPDYREMVAERERGEIEGAAA